MNPSTRPVHAPRPENLQAFLPGWDAAPAGRVPMAGPSRPDAAVRQGRRAAQSVSCQPAVQPSRHERRWQALRLQARRQGLDFDEKGFTPSHLAALEVTHCPITRRALGGPAHDDDAAELVCVGGQGWSVGSVLMVSRLAAHALAVATADGALRWARCAEQEGPAAAMGLDGPAWRRVASLLAFARSADHAQCARLPATLLPPPRLQVWGAAHRLQAALTRQLSRPGWSRRLRELVDPLGPGAAREAYLLWMGSLAPRVLELPAAPGPSVEARHALEDIWLDVRVQQRWQQCLLTLGPEGTEALLARAGAAWGADAAAPVPERREFSRTAPPGATAACAASAPRLPPVVRVATCHSRRTGPDAARAPRAARNPAGTARL